MGEVATLVKFGTHEHITQLQQTGLLYMNNLPYFWEIEDKELRGDPCDGVEKIMRGCAGKGTTEDGREFEITNWTLRVHPPEATRTNIFCMYCATSGAGTFPVDERNVRFGDYACS